MPEIPDEDAQYPSPVRSELDMPRFRSVAAWCLVAAAFLSSAVNAQFDAPAPAAVPDQTTPQPPPAPEPLPSSEQLPMDNQTAVLLNDLGVKPLRSITISLDPPRSELSDKMPVDMAQDVFQKAGEEFQPSGATRLWSQSTYAWVPAAIAFHPLYFEDEGLERYGHHHGLLQPAVSAAHFFGRLPVIPYMVGASPMRECHYALGYYRPGDCVPPFVTLPMASVRGALLQGAAVVGGVFLIP
jgi:hypothetical protein